jgi:integrase
LLIMPKANAANERIKWDYFRFLTEAKGRDEATIDRVAKSLARFEDSTGRKDFKRFHREQAMAFKRQLANALNARSGQKLSKATIHSALRDLKAFFEWLSREPGYRSKIEYADADYFNLKEKDATIARARREKAVPTLEQVEAVLAAMPGETALERRDRALLAFTTITGARVNALATFQLGHVDLAGGFVEQDARVVATKFAKTFRTYFMPVSERSLELVRAWCQELREDHLWGPADPLFPATAMGLDGNGAFQPQGLARHGWASTGPIREVFMRAFAAADLPYFNPHSFRSMLVQHAMRLGLSAEEMKAWSQNLGHSDVMTTFTSYGSVPVHRQGELIRTQGLASRASASREQIASLEALLSGLKAGGTAGLRGTGDDR